MDKYKLFLSASIPTQGREYYGSTNDAAITGAVMAFTRVCAEYSIPFYFGGHPAVTPLVWSVAKDYNKYFENLLSIYQSRKWEGFQPQQVSYFKKIIWTNAGHGREDSLEIMRTRMFTENKTAVAVFIGGMQGVIDEYHLLKKISPNTKIIAFKSTGGASADVYEEEGIEIGELQNSFAYYQIFKKLLKDYQFEYGREA